MECGHGETCPGHHHEELNIRAQHLAEHIGHACMSGTCGHPEHIGGATPDVLRVEEQQAFMEKLREEEDKKKKESKESKKGKETAKRLPLFEVITAKAA